MERLTPDDPETKSADIIAENLEGLRALFPEAFTEGQIDFEVLRQLLGDAVDEGEEKFGLNWHGKRRARQLALTPSTGTLRPVPEESLDWDTTQNLIIEGDNLEVLKLLQKSYAGKVKLIYIDPPYNTGKDFVYRDDFRDNIRNYLERTGQIDEAGRKWSTNTEASGRLHTNWLNMMYPRLKLARNLLREDGVLLVSIDDSENANLRELLSDVFGDDNLLAQLVWDLGTGTAAGHFARAHEYVLAFARDKGVLENFRYSGPSEVISERAIKKISRANPASRICFPAGIEFEGADVVLEGEQGGSEVVRIVEGRMVCKNGCLAEPVTIEAGWAMRNQILSWLEGQETYDSKGQKVLRFFFDSKGRLQYEKERGYVNPQSVLRGIASTRKGSATVEALLGARVFDFPKPVELLSYLINLVADDHDIVLDFFAGSCTTAQSVLELNCDGDMSRRFIMVQIPEPTADDSVARAAGFNTIADIGEERVRRAAANIRRENPDYTGDLGFRVFKLDSTNIRAWDPDPEDLDQTVIDAEDHLRSDRTEDDILYELLLKLGLDLCVPMETRTLAGKQVHSIGAGVLMACLADTISREDVEPLTQGIIAWHEELKPAGDTTCVFRDSAFADDVAKTNLSAILEQHGLTNVRSL